MAWSELYPWFYRDKDGSTAGFAVDLATEVGREVGFDIEPIDVKTYPAWGAAQASGASILLPAVARLRGLVATNLFSDPILTTKVRLAVRVDSKQTFNPDDLTGQRIGVLSPGAGSDPSLLPGATLIDYPDTRTALLGLLSGEVDAISAEATFVFAEAWRARLDHRITFVGKPLQDIERYIAIHESRADLLGPINEALSKMKSDGRLNGLLRRYNTSVPDPAPDILKVGVFELSPFMTMNEDGEANGFAIDVLRDLASTAGLTLDFVSIDMQGMVPGPTHDILPIVSRTEARAKIMDFVYPIDSNEFSIFVRAEDTSSVGKLADLIDRRVGVFEVSLTNRLAAAAGIENIVEFAEGATITDLLDALISDEVDAILFERKTVLAALSDSQFEDVVQEISPPFHTTQRTPALRLGLGEVRERFNAVIPAYLASPKYLALREQYFGEPVFWTQTRIIMALSIAGGTVFIAVIFGLLSQIRALRRVTKAEARADISDRLALQQGLELETIFNAATNGIVAINLSGDVVRANNAARHMLGGISDPTPFSWPDNIRFLDSETLKPLDASADPLQRALSGNRLNKETHLMQRNRSGEDRRYVRIDSAWLRTDDGSDLVVLVIDDVSNEERNRQVVERKGRLDALGQLTGGIAHDFNNLLTSLLYSIVLAARTKEAGDRDQHLKDAEAAVTRGRSLTGRLLTFARRQPGMATASSVKKVYDDFQRLVRPMLEANVSIEAELNDPDLIIYCDLAQLESALMNLTLNSRDAILQSGVGERIRLKARAVSDPSTRDQASTVDSKHLRYVELTVEDNGPGMNEETLARATDPFFTTKETNSGTGLGLAMVYGFARQANGDLKIYSEVGVGTSVQLTLPRGTADGQRDDTVFDPEIEPGNGQTILLVEDEVQILMVTSKLLEDFGYDVVTAASGKEALHLVRDGQPFDLLLTDVVMPGDLGGFDLARRVREYRPDVPVIYVSGYTGFTSSEMGEVIAPLLQKPAHPADLARAIAHVFSAASNKVSD